MIKRVELSAQGILYLSFLLDLVLLTTAHEKAVFIGAARLE